MSLLLEVGGAGEGGWGPYSQPLREVSKDWGTPFPLVNSPKQVGYLPVEQTPATLCRAKGTPAGRKRGLMSKWKFRVSSPRGPVEVISSHLLDGKTRPREGSQPSGPHSELVAQLGLSLGRNVACHSLRLQSLGSWVTGWPYSPRTCTK